MKTLCSGSLILFLIIAGHGFVKSQTSINYNQYAAIENADADRFVSDGLKYAQQLYGNSVIPVKKVVVAQSQERYYTLCYG